MSPRRAGAAKPSGPVTRADIEAKLRQISDQVNRTTEAARPKLMAVAVAAAAGLVAATYLMGRRRGRRTATVVEVRRV